MMPNDVKQVVERIVGVAKKAASDAAVSFGTVLSRNPDGSLNVDPGNGGCVRVIGPKNARVGDRVPLGTEPALGTLTRLDPHLIDVPSAVSGCPIDPRDLTGDPPIIVIPAGSETVLYCQDWADRKTDMGLIAGGPANGALALSTAGACNAASKYTVVGGFAKDYYQCDRAYFVMPLTGLKAGDSLYTASFDAHITVAGFAPIDLHLVLSHAVNAPVQTSDIPLAELVSLGSARVPATALGVPPYTPFSIPFNSDGLRAIEAAIPSGEIRLAVVTEYDWSGNPPPPLSPHSIGLFHFYGATFDLTSPSSISFQTISL